MIEHSSETKISNNITISYDSYISLDLIDMFSEVIAASIQTLNDLNNGIMDSFKMTFKVFQNNRNISTYFKQDFPTNLIFISKFDGTNATIVCDASFISSIEKEPQRRTRHLHHEFCHLINWEYTNSKKTMGDDNSQINIQPWVDEGIAEIISSLITKNHSLIDESIDFYKQSKQEWSEDELNSCLCDLNCPNRRDAFLFSIGKIYTAYSDSINSMTQLHLLKKIIATS